MAKMKGSRAPAESVPVVEAEVVEAGSVMALDEASPNSNLSAVRRWLVKPHRRAATMRLVVPDEPPTVLVSWERDEIVPGAAIEVVQSLEDHAQATGRTVSASLQQVSNEGEVLVSKLLTRRFSKDDVLRLSGSSADQAAQAQRHLEIIMRQASNERFQLTQQVIRLSETALRVAEGVSAHMSRQLAVGEDEATTLRRRLQQLERERREAGSEQDEETGDDVQKQLLEVMAMAIPLLGKGGASVAQVAQVVSAAAGGPAGGDGK
jgi:hypothetical protein